MLGDADSAQAALGQLQELNLPSYRFCHWLGVSELYRRASGLLNRAKPHLGEQILAAISKDRYRIFLDNRGAAWAGLLNALLDAMRYDSHEISSQISPELLEGWKFVGVKSTHNDNLERAIVDLRRKRAQSAEIADIAVPKAPHSQKTARFYSPMPNF